MGRAGMIAPELIAKLYEAAVEPDGLESLSLIIRRILEIDSAGFWLIRDGSVVEIANTPDIRASEPAYLARYHALDPWTDHDPSRFGVVTLASERFPESELFATEFFRDFACQYGMIRPMGVTINLQDGLLATVAANRVAPGNLLDERDKAKMQALVVHLAAALRLRLRFTTLRAVATIREEALDALSFPLIICDGEGVVAFANREACALAGKAGPFHVSDGRVGVRHARDRDRFRGALARASRGEGGGVRLGDEADEPVVLTVTPAPPRLSGAPNRVLLSLPQSRSADPQRWLSDAFRLTPAQAELCRALAAGQTFEEAALAKGVKISTMRSHFKAVLTKTGAQNLRDLLRMMASQPQVSSIVALTLIF